jgi:hypothetical protein
MTTEINNCQGKDAKVEKIVKCGECGMEVK